MARFHFLSLFVTAAISMAVGPARSAPAQEGSEQDSASSASAPAPTMSDASITLAVEDELHFDPLVSSASVNVRVRDGAITLTGETRSLLAKERAERIAETVQGVRTVENKIEVRPGIRRDAEETRRLILLNLQQDPVADAFDITVLATNAGDVTLRGKVDSWTERLFVGMAAQRVIGVRSVQNEVEIVPKTQRFDSDVQADVEGKLNWDAHIDSRNIDVNVTSGVVRLSGTVRSAAEKRRAMSIAWGPGVKAVSARELQVVSADRADRKRAATVRTRANDDVARVITAKYALSPRLSNAGVRVDVDGGVVTLRGVVRNLRALRAASALARNTSGVQQVRNRLRIGVPDVALPDSEIRDAVEQALRRDAVTSAADVEVRIHDGRVELRGEVDSSLARAAAEDIAAGVRGVNAVDNDLVVDPDARRYVLDPYVDDWLDFDYDAGSALRGDTPVAAAKQRDRYIEAQIRNQFWWSPFVNQDTVDVTVEEGVATLSGVVGTYAERSTAVENALEGGAVAVVNQIQIAE